MAIKKDGQKSQDPKEAVLEMRDALNQRIKEQNEKGENIPGKFNLSEDHLLDYFNPDKEENWPM